MHLLEESFARGFTVLGAVSFVASHVQQAVQSLQWKAELTDSGGRRICGVFTFLKLPY